MYTEVMIEACNLILKECNNNSNKIEFNDFALEIKDDIYKETSKFPLNITLTPRILAIAY